MPDTEIWIDDIPVGAASLRCRDGCDPHQLLQILGMRTNDPISTVPAELNQPCLGLSFADMIADVWDGIAPLGKELGAPYAPSIQSLLFDQTGPRKTYFVCDAAALPGFFGPEAVAGLRCQSLFDGDAADTLSEAAPYLIELDPEHTFTRSLFTDGRMPWAYWDKQAGIFLRSPIDFDALRKNFRRFTKLLDDTGKWVFLRFFAPQSLLHIALAMQPPMRARFFDGDLQMIGIYPSVQLAIVCRSTAQAAPVSLGIDMRMRQVLDASAMTAFRQRAIRFCTDTLPDGAGIDAKRQDDFARQTILTAQQQGLFAEQAVLYAIAAGWFVGSSDGAWVKAQDDILHRKDQSQIEKGKALLARAMQQTKTTERHA